MIDVAVSYDIEDYLEAAYNRKVAKYQHLGRVFPLIVVGSLGSRYPANDNIRSLLASNGRRWATFGRKARVAVIHGSMSIIRDHKDKANNRRRGQQRVLVLYSCFIV